MNYVCKEGKTCWCLKHSPVVIPAFISQWPRLHFTRTLHSHLKQQSYPQPAARMRWKTPFLFTANTPNSLFSSPLQVQGLFWWLGFVFVRMVLVEAACLTALLAKICCLSTEQERLVPLKLSYSHHLHAASLLWRSTSRGESVLLSLS